MAGKQAPRSTPYRLTVRALAGRRRNKLATHRQSGGNNMESASKPAARTVRPKHGKLGLCLLKDARLPMSSDSFERRVHALRESWAERRQLRTLGSSHEFEPQFQLLESLHAFAASAVRDIRAVYEDALDIDLSPLPRRSDEQPAFSVAIAERWLVTFTLSERRRAGAIRWFVSVTIGSGGPGGAITAAGPERRNGQWTRLRVEDILLSVLGAYERNLAETGRIPPGSLRARGA